jgi:uncharacterized membrane protein YfhO
MFKNIVKKMEHNIGSIKMLNNSAILYGLLMIALVNMYSYVMTNRQLYVVFMLIIGFLTSFFSKNMIVILFVAIVIPNIIRFSSEYQFREGFEGEEGDKKSDLTKPSFTQKDLTDLVDIHNLDDTDKPAAAKDKMDKVSQNMGSMQEKIQSALKTADTIKDDDKKKKVKDVLNKQLAMITTLSGMGDKFHEIMNDMETNVPQLTKDDFDTSAKSE